MNTFVIENRIKALVICSNLMLWVFLKIILLILMKLSSTCIRPICFS